MNLLGRTLSSLKFLNKSVHALARSMIAESVGFARERIEEAHRRYAAVYSESLVGLSACKLLNERLSSSISLSLDWDDVRVKLQNRNRKLTNLRKRYVTGRFN